MNSFSKNWKRSLIKFKFNNIIRDLVREKHLSVIIGNNIATHTKKNNTQFVCDCLNDLPLICDIDLVWLLKQALLTKNTMLLY